MGGGGNNAGWRECKFRRYQHSKKERITLSDNLQVTLGGLVSNLLLEGKGRFNSTAKFIAWVIGKTMMPLLTRQFQKEEKSLGRTIMD